MNESLVYRPARDAEFIYTVPAASPRGRRAGGCSVGTAVAQPPPGAVISPLCSINKYDKNQYSVLELSPLLPSPYFVTPVFLSVSPLESRWFLSPSSFIPVPEVPLNTSMDWPQDSSWLYYLTRTCWLWSTAVGQHPSGGVCKGNPAASHCLPWRRAPLPRGGQGGSSTRHLSRAGTVSV